MLVKRTFMVPAAYQRRQSLKTAYLHVWITLLLGCNLGCNPGFSKTLRRRSCCGTRLARGNIKFRSSAPIFARMMLRRLPVFAILECTLMLTCPCGHIMRRQCLAGSPSYVIFVVYADLFRNRVIQVTRRNASTDSLGL